MSRKSLFSPSQKDSLDNDIWTFNEVEIESFFRFDEKEMSFILDLPESAIQRYGSGREETRREHLQELYEEFGFERFAKKHEALLEKPLLELAMRVNQGMVLAHRLKRELRQRRLIYLSIGQLEEFCRRIKDTAEEQIIETLNNSLNPGQKERLDTLFEKKDNHTNLSWLKRRSKRISTPGMLRIIEKLTFIDEFKLDPELRNSIPRNRLNQLAGEASRYRKDRKKTSNQAKQQAVLLAFLLKSREELLDQAVELHDKLMSQHIRKSELKQDSELKTNFPAINEKVKLYGTVGRGLISAREEKADAYEAIESVIDWENFISTVVEAEKLTKSDDYNFLEDLPSRFTELRKYTPKFLDILEVKTTKASSSLKRGLDLIRQNNEDGKRKIPNDAPVDFIRPKLRKFVFDKGGEINRQYYEMAMLNELRHSFRSGDISLPDSRKHQDFESYLLSLERFSFLWETDSLGGSRS